MEWIKTEAKKKKDEKDEKDLKKKSSITWLKEAAQETPAEPTWKKVEAGLEMDIEGFKVIAKTEEEAKKIDSCVEAKMKDPDFKPEGDRSKKQSAFAVCTASVMGTTKRGSEEEEKEDKKEEKKEEKKASEEKPFEPPKELVASLTKSLEERAAKDPAFKEVFAKQGKDIAVTPLVKMAKILDRKEIDIIRLAHYSIDCPDCFAAIMTNIEKGLVPTDFLVKPRV